MGLGKIPGAAKCGEMRQIAEDRRSLFAPRFGGVHDRLDARGTVRNRQHNERMVALEPWRRLNGRTRPCRARSIERQSSLVVHGYRG